MAIEESKISDLIASYEGYEGSAISISRTDLYRSVIKDLKGLLPRKTLAEMEVTHLAELTGTIVEYGGKRGVFLGGGSDVVTLFTFADKCVVYTYPSLVHALDEDRLWDEAGTIL